MITSKFDAKWEDDKVHIINEEGETVRSVSPTHMNTYKFRDNGKTYYFLYEESNIRGNLIRAVYLYPLNEFKNNKIEL